MLPTDRVNVGRFIVGIMVEQNITDAFSLPYGNACRVQVLDGIRYTPLYGSVIKIVPILPRKLVRIKLEES